MRIVHFSDWHGQKMKLPKADLYACTGDLLPNFVRVKFAMPTGGFEWWDSNMELVGNVPLKRPRGITVERDVDHEQEERLQALFVSLQGRGYLREWMGSPDAPVVCCRGNHDFVDLAPCFEGGPTFEVGLDPTATFELGGVRFGGTRGIPYIVGEWSDELRDAEMDGACRALSADCDVLVTHMAPRGIRDSADGEELGSVPLRSYLTRRSLMAPSLRAHLFGHIHEGSGVSDLGGTTFSNGARGFNVIDVEER
jgi:Icc-related predicted phosphoesterase